MLLMIEYLDENHQQSHLINTNLLDEKLKTFLERSIEKNGLALLKGSHYSTAFQKAQLPLIHNFPITIHGLVKVYNQSY